MNYYKFIFFLVITSIIDLLGLFIVYKFIDMVGLGLISTYLDTLSKTYSISLGFIYIIFCIVIIVIFAIVSFSRILNTYYLYFLPNVIRTEIINLIVKYNLYSSYNIYLSRNIDSDIKDALTEVDELADQVLLPFFSIINFSVQFIILSIYLIYVSLLATIFAIFIFGTSYVLIALYTKKRLHYSSAVRNQSVEARAHLISDSFRGRKILQIYNLRNEYSSLINDESYKIAGANINFSLLALSPKYIIETLAIIVFLIGYSLFVMDGSGLNTENTALIGLFLLSSYRLMPVIQGFYQNSYSIRYGQPVLDRILALSLNFKPAKSPFMLKEPDKSSEILEPWYIKLENITVELSGKKILSDVSFNINQGEKIILTGPSGAGKTILADTVAGLVEPAHGTVQIFGRENLNIALVPQFPIFKDGTVKENVTLGRYNKSDAWLREILIRMGLATNSDTVAQFLNKKLTSTNFTLSGGQAQRLMLIRALFFDPDLLILDEATSALDDKNTRKVIEEISFEKQRTVLFISHDPIVLNEFKSCIKVDNGFAVRVTD